MVVAQRARVGDRVGTAITTTLDVVHSVGPLAATGNDAHTFVDREPQRSQLSPVVRFVVPIRRHHPIARFDPLAGDSVRFGGSNSLTSLPASSLFKSLIFVVLTIFTGLDPMKRAAAGPRITQASHSREQI